MSVWLIAAIALLTYSTRASALVFLPAPPPRLAPLLERVPAPLFAGFAALALVQSDGTWAPVPVLAAAGAAVCAAPSRSLPVIIGGGIAGYVVATLIV